MATFPVAAPEAVALFVNAEPVFFLIALASEVRKQTFASVGRGSESTLRCTHTHKPRTKLSVPPEASGNWVPAPILCGNWDRRLAVLSSVVQIHAHGLILKSADNRRRVGHKNAPYLFTCYPSPNPPPGAPFQTTAGGGGSTYHAVIKLSRGEQALRGNGGTGSQTGKGEKDFGKRRVEILGGKALGGKRGKGS